MATLGTLVTMVTADTSGFSSGLTKAAGEAKQFASTVSSSQQSLNASIMGTMKGLEGNYGVFLKLAVGAHFARAAFHAAHEGIVHFAEGFSAAQGAGLSFTESISDAFTAMLGLQTEVKRHAEAMKEFHAVTEAAATAQEHFNKALEEASIGHPVRDHENLGPGVDTGLEDKRKAFNAANKLAGEANQKVQDYKPLIGLAAPNLADPSHSAMRQHLANLEADAKQASDLAKSLGNDLNDSRTDADSLDNRLGKTIRPSAALDDAGKEWDSFLKELQKNAKQNHDAQNESIMQTSAEIGKVVDARNKELEAITKMNQTPWEKYAEGLAKVNEMVGELSPETVAREKERLKKQLGQDLDKGTKDTTSKLGVGSIESVMEKVQLAALGGTTNKGNDAELRAAKAAEAAIAQRNQEIEAINTLTGTVAKIGGISWL